MPSGADEYWAEQNYNDPGCTLSHDRFRLKRDKGDPVSNPGYVRSIDPRKVAMCRGIGALFRYAASHE